MLDFHDHTRYKLPDIADIERPKKDKVYPAGTVCIQVSASHGQVHRLKKAGTIESKYAVVIPKISIIPAYFQIAIENMMPEFTAKYQSTINIQMDSFRYFDIDIHNSMEVQAHICAVNEQVEKVLEIEEKLLEVMEEEKKYYLDALIVSEDLTNLC